MHKCSLCTSLVLSPNEPKDHKPTSQRSKFIVFAPKSGHPITLLPHIYIILCQCLCSFTYTCIMFNEYYNTIILL